MKGNCTLELDVDSVTLNNAMSKAVSDAVKSLNIEQIVNAEVTRRIGKSCLLYTSPSPRDRG